MLKNLIAEMARAGISQKDLAKLIEKDERSISNKKRNGGNKEELFS